MTLSTVNYVLLRHRAEWILPWISLPLLLVSIAIAVAAPDIGGHMVYATGSTGDNDILAQIQ